MKTKYFLVFALALAACGDDNATMQDARPSPMPDAPVGPKVFKQVEHLGRPGVNEALLISHAFNAGYNSTAPSFTGVDAATLGMVVAEAKTVLKALYLGACLLNGTVTVNPATGVKPAGFTCVEIGGAIFTENSLAGVTLKATVAAQAQQYADQVFDQFEPDVLRIDMTVNPSSYETLCGGANTKPLLCGGRFLDDDVIDTTYDYFLNGAGTPQGAAATYNQVSALVSDGVQFGTTGNKNNRTPPSAGNTAQFHPAVNAAFPYSANPL